MVHLYIHLRHWVAARCAHARADDRGVTVEKVIIVGLGALMAVAVMTAIGDDVRQAVERIDFGF